MASSLERVERELKGLKRLRDHEQWEAMVHNVESLPSEVRASPAIRQQLGLALNRAGRSSEAEVVLTELIDEHQDLARTYGLLGRVYKDRWLEKNDGEELNRAIDAYTKGFAANPQNPYPGINALTLLTARDPGDEAIGPLARMVKSALDRKAADSPGDYFDAATYLELAVITMDEPAAKGALNRALKLAEGPWEPETTANNLKLLRRARERFGTSPDWTRAVENDLLRKARDLRAKNL